MFEVAEWLEETRQVLAANLSIPLLLTFSTDIELDSGLRRPPLLDLSQGNTFEAAEYLVGTRQVQRLLAVNVSFVSLLVFRKLSYHRTRMRFPTRIRLQRSAPTARLAQGLYSEVRLTDFGENCSVFRSILKNYDPQRDKHFSGTVK